MRWSDDVRLGFALCLLIVALTCGVPVLAQVTAVPTPDGGTLPVGGRSEIETTTVLAMMVTTVFEWLKRQPWFNLVSEKTVWGWQRVVGIVLAFAQAVGVHFAYDASTGTFTATGLTMDLMWDAARSYLIQEFFYRNGVKNYRRGVLA